MSLTYLIKTKGACETLSDKACVETRTVYTAIATAGQHAGHLIVHEVYMQYNRHKCAPNSVTHVGAYNSKFSGAAKPALLRLLALLICMVSST